jgi:hypothetical protein
LRNCPDISLTYLAIAFCLFVSLCILCPCHLAETMLKALQNWLELNCFW